MTVTRINRHWRFNEMLIKCYFKWATTWRSMKREVINFQGEIHKSNNTGEVAVIGKLPVTIYEICSDILILRNGQRWCTARYLLWTRACNGVVIQWAQDKLNVGRRQVTCFQNSRRNRNADFIPYQGSLFCEELRQIMSNDEPVDPVAVIMQHD